MFLNSLTGRTALTVRLVGLAAILYSIFQADRHAPALSGRGLVVLIITVIGIVAWLYWMFAADSGREGPVVDQCLLAICGALLATACPDSAGSVFAFVGCVSAGARAGLSRGAMIALVGGVVVAVGALIYDQSGVNVIAYTLGFAACALGGSNIRAARQRAEQAELLLAQTQRSHEEQLRNAQLQEQTRLARDIHDVLAHSLAGLTIQLEATSALIDNGADAEQIKQRVERARELAREGLNETRRAVATLRGEGGAAAAPPASAVGEQLSALAEGYQDGDGNPARYELSGDPGILNGQLGDTVLRTVQEAITNVRKHAPGAHVTVTVACGPGSVRVRIDNDGSGLPGSAMAATGGGFGLRGMRERAELTGGTFAAGPAEQGWRVELEAPVGRPQPGPAATDSVLPGVAERPQ